MKKEKEYQQCYEIEEKWNKIIKKQNDLLMFGSLIVMWILLIFQENIFIALLPILPTFYIMIKDIFFSGGENEI